MSDIQQPTPAPVNMSSIGKIDIMKIQQTLRAMKEAEPIDLIQKYHEWEQQAQDSNQHVLWSPKFREHIVNAFGKDPEIKAMIEKLYLEILNELYDAQESIRDKVRKVVNELLEDAGAKLGM